MEAVMLLGIAACVAACERLLMPASSQPRVPLPLVLERARLSAQRFALLWLGRLSQTAVVEYLMARACWARTARRLAELPQVAQLRVSPHVCCAGVLAAQVAAAVLVGVLMGSAVCVPVVLCVALAAVPAVDARALDLERKKTMAQMPQVFRTLSVAMGSGQTLTQAVEYVGAHSTGQVSECFSRLGLRLKCGQTTEEALGCLHNELDAPGIGLLSTALVVAHRTGSPLRHLFQKSALLVERQSDYERMLAVKTAQARLSVRIVCLLPALLVVCLTFISPDFQRGLLTPSGFGCVAVAALLDLLAVAIVRHLIKGVL